MVSRTAARTACHSTLARFLFAGGLMSLATGLCLGMIPARQDPPVSLGLGASDVKGQPRTESEKLEVLKRMLDIGERVGELRSMRPDREIDRTLQSLMREYQTLSAMMGGDDPAHLGSVGGSGAPIHAVEQGGIASAPAAPSGCTSASATFTNNVAAPIPNASNRNSLVSSQITVSGLATFLWDVNLRTFLTHPNGLHIDMTLMSPAGTVVTITTDNGNGANNFNGTLWDDDANPVGTVPYTSNVGLATDQAFAVSSLATPLVPEEALGAFFGEDPNGVWTLTINDDTADGSNGTLTSWSLDIGTVAAAPTITTTPVASTDVPKSISSSGTPTVTSTALVAGAGSVITDVNLTTGLIHTACGDLDMTITSPAGTVVTLTTDNGGSNDNVFDGTVWDDDANPAGVLPQPGNNNGVASDHGYVNLTPAASLVPEEAMAAFIGENPNGTWTLSISDDANGDGGTLNTWSLSIDTTTSSPAVTTTTFSNLTPLTGIDSIPPVLVASTINVSGASAYLWDLDLATTIAHTASQDLDITLTSPAGTVVTITTDNGSTNDNNFNGTTWDDDADPLGIVPYANPVAMATDASYINNTILNPLVVEEALGAFVGEDPNGTWTLTINDDAPTVDSGTRSSWSLTVTTINQPPTNTLTNASNNTPAAISTGGPSTITSSIVVSGAGTFISDVNAVTNITHAFCSDIDMTLTSPAGTIVTLTTDNGGGNDNVYNGTTWDDDANPSGTIPQTANNGVASDQTYADNVVATPLVPEEALAAFIGENPNGTWTLTIFDDTTGSGGSLNSWSLAINTAICAGLPCPANVVINVPGPQAVDTDDLILLIGSWGACGGCPADIAPPGGDGFVNTDDLLLIIGAWGPCP